MKYSTILVLLAIGLTAASANEGKIIQKEGVYFSPQGTSKLVLERSAGGISVSLFRKWGTENSSVSFISKIENTDWVCFHEEEGKVWFYDGQKILHVIEIKGDSFESGAHEVTPTSEITPKALVGFIK